MTFIQSQNLLNYIIAEWKEWLLFKDQHYKENERGSLVLYFGQFELHIVWA